MSLNRTIWPPYLYIYDDLLIFKKRRWFKLREVTVSYNQISGIEVTQGILFSELDVITTGIENIKLRYISKKGAKQAKKIIDQKIYHSHAKHQSVAPSNIDSTKNYELSLNRLNELLAKGLITEKDFEKKRKELLKTV